MLLVHPATIDEYGQTLDALGLLTVEGPRRGRTAEIETDPTQHNRFRDAFVELAFDLSEVVRVRGRQVLEQMSARAPSELDHDRAGE